MSLYKVQCEVFIEADSVESASADVYDVLNHAVNNYDGWAAGSVELAELYSEEV